VSVLGWKLIIWDQPREVIPISGHERHQRQNQTYLTADGQSASLSWYQATIRESQSMFFQVHGKYFQTIAVFILWGALSDEGT
jgi:hypothetical protein